MVLKRIGVLSAAKIAGLMYALFGLFAGAIFSFFALIGGAIGASAGESEALVGILFGVGAIVIMPIFYGFFGLIGGWISALLYNLLANIAGGLVLELEPEGGATSGLSSGPTQSPATY